MEPRYYQQAAATRAWEYLRDCDGNPCIVLPTGAGKSLTMSLMIRDAVARGKRVLLVTHAKELLTQIGNTLARIGVTDVGYYSAGMGRRDTDNAVILASIQSAYSKAEVFGGRDYVFIDEAHRINPKSSDTMYGQLFDSMPKARLIGFTATPYRLGCGSIVDDDSWLNKIVYEVSVRELVESGYLCRLTSKWMQGIETESLAIRNGDFAEEDQQEAFLAITDSICADILERTETRNSVLIFCSGVAAVKKTQQWFRGQGIVCGAITGDTDDASREEYIEAFRSGEIKYLANCNVLTEGFDAPNIDAIALVRATMSPGLYYQMAGRGLRLHESKSNCLILDYGENIARHGPIDRVAPSVMQVQSDGQKKKASKKIEHYKPCPGCRNAVAIAASTCDVCGFEFQDEREKKLHKKPSKEAAMSDEAEIGDGNWYPVRTMTVKAHTKKNSEGAPKTLAVSYFEGLPIGHPVARQFVCVEHSGFPRKKAEDWWKKFTPNVPLPKSADEAAELISKALTAKTITPPTAIRCTQSTYDPRYLDIRELSWSTDHAAKADQEAEDYNGDF